MSEPAVSLRRGNYYPSVKYKPEQSYLQNQTNYKLGTDRTLFQSTAHSAQRHAFRPREELIVRPPIIEKNASDKDSIQGEQVGRYSQSSEIYRSSNALQFHAGTSALSSQYRKQQPCFDRLNACKTNYSLGQYHPPKGLQTATHDHFCHPRSKPQPPQPTVGGWQQADGSYKREFSAIESVVRGGGGGAGILGVEFDIITGRADATKRNRNQQQTGVRRSENTREQWEHGQDRWGDHTRPLDILTGQAKEPVRVPPLPTREQLKRPDVPALSSRPW